MTDGSHDGFQEVPGIQLYLITMSHLVPPLKQEMLVQLEKLLNSFSVRNWYKILYMKQIRCAEQNRNYASRSLFMFLFLLCKFKCNILVIIILIFFTSWLRIPQPIIDGFHCRQTGVHLSHTRN